MLYCPDARQGQGKGESQVRQNLSLGVCNLSEETGGAAGLLHMGLSKWATDKVIVINAQHGGTTSQAGPRHMPPAQAQVSISAMGLLGSQ